METKKNSVAVLVATAVMNCVKKYEKELSVFIQQQPEVFQEKEREEQDKEIAENFTFPFVSRIKDNADSILTKTGIAINWNGVKDSPSERIAKVYSSCIRDSKKTPKIIKEMFSTDIHWLIADMLFEGSKKKTVSIVEVDLDF